MTKVTLPSGKYLIVDVPEGTVAVELYDKECLPLAIMAYIKDPKGMFTPGIPQPVYPIPPGSYTLIGVDPLNFTEDEWLKIIEHRYTLARLISRMLNWNTVKNKIKILGWQ